MWFYMKRKLLSKLIGAVTVLTVPTMMVAYAPVVGAATVSTARTTVSFMRSVCTGTLITAHRGTGVGTNSNPVGRSTEDTIHSANIAYRYGMNQSETDYHQSAQGTYWQIHDDNLSRVTNGRDNRKLRYMTDAQIEAVVLPDGSRLASEDRAARNLKYGPYQGRSGQWEIKAEATSDSDLQRFVGVIRQYGLQDQVMITTSRQGVGRRLARIAPDIARFYVWYPNHSRPRLGNVSQSFNGLNIDASQASPRYVRAAYNHGFKVSARNAETSRQWRELMHRSASTRPYNVLTDVPWRYHSWCGRQ